MTAAKGMGDIYEAADAAIGRLEYVDAFLCMINRGIPDLSKMDDDKVEPSILLDYVRNACNGIRMVLTDVTTDVDEIRRIADEATGKGKAS
jgi:hypothetical protein